MTDRGKLILGVGAVAAFVIVQKKGGLAATLKAKPLTAKPPTLSPSVIRPTTTQLATGTAPPTGRVGPASVSVPVGAAVAGGNALGNLLARLFGGNTAKAPTPAGQAAASAPKLSMAPGGSAGSPGGGSATTPGRAAGSPPKSAGGPGQAPAYDPYKAGDYINAATGEYDPTLDPANYDAYGQYYGPGAYDPSSPLYNPTVAETASVSNSGINYGPGPVTGPDDAGNYYDNAGNAYARDDATGNYYDNAGNAYDSSLTPITDQPDQPLAVDETGQYAPDAEAGMSLDNGVDYNQFNVGPSVETYDAGSDAGADYTDWGAG